MLCRLQCYSFHFKMLKERVDWLEALLDYTMLFVSCNWRLPEAKLRVRKILCQHITYRISLSECLDFFFNSNRVHFKRSSQFQIMSRPTGGSLF